MVQNETVEEINPPVPIGVCPECKQPVTDADLLCPNCRVPREVFNARGGIGTMLMMIAGMLFLFSFWLVSIERIRILGIIGFASCVGFFATGRAISTKWKIMRW